MINNSINVSRLLVLSDGIHFVYSNVDHFLRFESLFGCVFSETPFSAVEIRLQDTHRIGRVAAEVT